MAQDAARAISRAPVAWAKSCRVVWRLGGPISSGARDTEDRSAGPSGQVGTVRSWTVTLLEPGASAIVPVVELLVPDEVDAMLWTKEGS